MPPHQKQLRSVAPDERKAKKPTTILEAAETGTRLDELQALRRRIARALDDPNTAARDLAALSRRQLEISREIDALTHREDDEVGAALEVPDEAIDAEAL